MKEIEVLDWLGGGIFAEFDVVSVVLAVPIVHSAVPLVRKAAIAYLRFCSWRLFLLLLLSSRSPAQLLRPPRVASSFLRRLDPFGLRLGASVPGVSWPCR